jgi:hypothetical protein
VKPDVIIKGKTGLPIEAFVADRFAAWTRWMIGGVEEMLWTGRTSLRSKLRPGRQDLLDFHNDFTRNISETRS